MKCGVGNKAKTRTQNGFNSLKCADLKKQLWKCFPQISKYAQFYYFCENQRNQREVEKE